MISAKTLKKAVTGRKVLIDSNIIIYLTDTIQPLATMAQMLFEMIEAGKAQAVVSILSVSEVMQGPLKKGYPQIAFEVRDYLLNFPNTQCQQITFQVLQKIGNDDRVRWKGLRTADSLIIASGLINHVDLFISNDRHFQNALPPKRFLSFDL